MSHSRKPALAKLLTHDPHASTTRRIAVAEVEEAIRQSKLETRLTSGTRKIVSAREIAAHLAGRESTGSVGAEQEQEHDESVDVSLESLAPPPAFPRQKLSPLTPFVITPNGPLIHDPNKTTLSRAQIPTVAIVMLISTAIFALLSFLAYVAR